VGVDGIVLRLRRGKRFFSSPNRADLIWGPPNHVFFGQQGKPTLGVKGSWREVDRSPQVVLRLRMSGAVPLHLDMP